MNLATAWLIAIFTLGFFPRLVHTYDLGGLTLFEPPSFFDSFDEMSAMIQRQQEAFQNAFLRGTNGWLPSTFMSPRFEITNDKDQFQVEVNIPGVPPDNIKVNFNEDDRLLTISGHHEAKNDDTGYMHSSQFSRSFTLDPYVEVDKMTATVSDGILTISAPKDADKMDHAVRSIPVLQLDEGEDVEQKLKISSAAMAESEEGETLRAVPNTSHEKKENDPFHVKERVEKARLHQPVSQEALAENPNDMLQNPASESGYKTSELRRR